jgi:hypothetical protein
MRRSLRFVTTRTTSAIWPRDLNRSAGRPVRLAGLVVANQKMRFRTPAKAATSGSTRYRARWQRCSESIGLPGLVTHSPPRKPRQGLRGRSRARSRGVRRQAVRAQPRGLTDVGSTRDRATPANWARSGAITRRILELWPDADLVISSGCPARSPSPRCGPGSASPPSCLRVTALGLDPQPERRDLRGPRPSAANRGSRPVGGPAGATHRWRGRGLTSRWRMERVRSTRARLRLPLRESRERPRRKGRGPEVVVGQVRQDRQCMPAVGPALPIQPPSRRPPSICLKTSTE